MHVTLPYLFPPEKETANRKAPQCQPDEDDANSSTSTSTSTSASKTSSEKVLINRHDLGALHTLIRKQGTKLVSSIILIPPASNPDAT